MGTATQQSSNGYTLWGSGLGITLATNLNNYLTPVNTYSNYTLFPIAGGCYRHWCSNEREASQGRTVCWYTYDTQTAEAMSSDTKNSTSYSNQHWDARSVIAF